MSPRRPRILTAVALLTTATLLAGCSGSEEKEPTAEVTRIADLNPATMNLVRISFCDLVPPAAIRAALRGPSTQHQEWGNGDVPPIDDAESDVTHEFGCAWSRSGGFAARAWVFARPVTAGFAGELIPAARARKGCKTRRATTFGDPGMTQLCPLSAKRTRVRHAGLFGDTWLTCEIVGPRSKAAPRVRADAWCARIASALDAKS